MKTRYKIALTLSLSFAAAFALEKVVYNDDFMYQPTEVELKIYEQKKNDITDASNTDNRGVASAERELPNIQYIRFNDENKDNIDGKWQVTRIIDHEEKVIFDINGRIEDKKKELFLDFKLEGTSLIHATYTEDKLVEDFYFDISRISDGGTRIALFRAYKNGYEIFEAKKLIKKPVQIGPQRVMRYPIARNTEINKKAKDVVGAKRDLVVNDLSKELILERAMYPSRAKGLLQGEESIVGSVSFGANSIDFLDVTLLPNSPSPIEIQLDYAEINKVGHFHYEEEDQNGNTRKASGLVTNNGEGGYRLRFVNGKHAGAMLSFVTERELRLMRDKAEELKLEQEMKNQDVEVDKAEVEAVSKRTPQSIGRATGFSFSNKAEKY